MPLLTLLLGFIFLVGLVVFILSVAKLIGDKWTKNYKVATKDDYRLDLILKNYDSKFWSSDDSLSINPASGLPMVSGGIDICGNIYGTRSNDIE